MEELTWELFLKAAGDCKIRRCSLESCRHNENLQCVLPEVNLNPQGKCEQADILEPRELRLRNIKRGARSLFNRKEPSYDGGRIE